MKLTIKKVPIEYVVQTWPYVRGFLEEAAKHCVDYTAEQLKVYLTMGAQELLVATDEENKIHGAATIEFINYPKERVAFVTAMGGRLITGPDTYKQFEDWMRSRGATKCRGASRESAARLWERFGFKPRYIIVEADL